MNVPPCSTPSLARPPKNTSHEMTTPSFVPSGRVSTAGPVPADGVARHEVGRRTERTEEATKRHVLAERDAADLVVAGDDRALAVRR